MNRTNTRISRALVGLLLLTLVIGGGAYLHNVSSHDRRAQRAAESNAIKPATPPPMQAAAVTAQPTHVPPATAPSVVPPLATSTTPVLVTQTPKAPVPVPVSVSAAPAPSTQPLAAAGAADAPPAAQPASAVIPAWSPTPAAAPAAPSADFLSVASTKAANGELLAARRLLNDALLSGHLSPADAAQARKQLADVNDTLVFSTRRFTDDEYGGTHLVQPGQRLSKIADTYEVPWELIARINGLSDPKKMKSGAKLKIIKGPFNVVVHKKTFVMDLYLGSTPGKPGSLYVKSFPVGLGRDDSTPMGTWLVDTGHKTKDPIYYSPRGEGVIAADDPKNPLGHRWIGLTGVDGQAVGQQSYGIHGTIDPDSIGKQASMGCIRMRNEDVEQVFDMLTEGKTTVIVQD